MPALGVGHGGSARSIFRNPRFLRLYLAGTVSLSGSQIGNVAILFLAYTASHSALTIALVSLAQSIPTVLFAVVGGTLADRYDRRRLMILADATRFCAFLAITLLVAIRGFELAPVLAVSAVNATFLMLFNPAQQAYLPRVVETDELASANGALQATLSIVGFLAFAAGGALVAVAGVGPALGLNALTFLGSALFLISIREVSRAPHASGEIRPSFLADLSAGFSYLRAQTGLLAITLSALSINFFITIPLLFLVVYSVSVLHGGSILFGAALAALAAGTAVGAPLVHRYRHWLLPNAGKVWCVHLALFGPPILALVFAPSFATAALAMFATGFLLGVGGTTWLSAAQIIVPSEMQGRYFGIDAFGSFAIIPMASLAGGLAIAAYGIGTTYLVAGVGAIIVGLVSSSIRPLWHFGTPPTGSGRSTDPDGPLRSPREVEGTRD